VQNEAHTYPLKIDARKTNRIAVLQALSPTATAVLSQRRTSGKLAGIISAIIYFRQGVPLHNTLLIINFSEGLIYALSVGLDL
jgi:hypothetical protein